MADEINEKTPYAPETGQPSEPAPKSAFGVFAGVFFEPGAAFQSLNQRPHGWLPLVLMVAVGLAFQFILIEKIGIENMIRMTNRSTQAQSAEAQEGIHKFATSAIAKPIFFTTALVSTIGLILIPAAVFAGLFALFGYGGGFKKIFSVTAHAMGAYYLVVGLLQALIILLKEDSMGLDLTNILQSNLGAFMEPGAGSPGLRSLLSSIDLFSFWLLFLLVKGYQAVMPKNNPKATAAIVISVWALFVCARAGWLALFSR